MKTLFILLDTVRRDYLQSYGSDWVQTPNLARLSERGVTFDNHWCGSLPCMPARRDILTGRLNFLDRPWGPIEPFDDVLPRELRKKGVFTHLVTDHDHYFELGGENYHTGFNTWEFMRGQEFDPWVSYVDALAQPDFQGRLGNQNWHNRQKQQQEADFSGPRTAQSAIEWLDANARSQGDWFLQVEIFDPHEPFYCPEKYREMYGDEWDGPQYDWPPYDFATESPEAVEHIRKCYAGLLTMTDAWVGKILDKLEETGQFDDTLIVFTTDHGTMLAEHGYWMKNYMPMWNEIVHIPLIVKLPQNARAGQRVDHLTQNIDLMPTFLDFHGCEIPPHVKSQSLKRVLEGETGREDAIFGYFGKALNITDGRYVYMRNPLNEDGGPIHAYTSMLQSGLNGWFPRAVYGQIETGRFLSHAYDLPLYKIPTRGEVPRAVPGEESYRARHLLFDIQNDPQQTNPLLDAALEAHFEARLCAHLRDYEAAPEQFERLGLDATSK